MTEQPCFFPLQTITDADLQNLSRCLWQWQLCDGCSGKPTCSTTTCHWSRAKRQEAFWTRYKELTVTYVPEFFNTRPALSSHADLLAIIELIKDRPNDTREVLIQRHFGSPSVTATDIPAIWDQNRAMNLAASILFSVDCSLSHERADVLEDHVSLSQWRSNTSASEFIQEAFPNDPDISSELEKKRLDWAVILPALSAKQLRDTSGLRMEATSNLRSHLTLDHERRVVRVFHCTAMLKEILSMPHSNAEAYLPREIVVEVLDTIYNVLFPPDRRSQALLASLVSKHGFDNDLLKYEGIGERANGTEEPSYPYFGARLIELYDEIQNPKPRTRLESWFERKSGARYMLMATMIGVFIAVIIGILGLGIAGFQAWVSYQQWKHPIKNG